MTADLAIIAMAVVSLTSTVLDHRHRMRLADRQRLVGPAKAPAPDKDAEEKSGRPSLRDAA